jgi:hypothetical protein
MDDDDILNLLLSTSERHKLYWRTVCIALINTSKLIMFTYFLVLWMKFINLAMADDVGARNIQ